MRIRWLVVRIGFMGEIDIRKGVGIFLDAIKQANSKMDVKKQARLHFKIYGKHFDDDLYHTMTAKVNDLKNATYWGCFTTEQRAQVFSEIDLLVMPSLGENYPFILREALYAGIPAVATAIAGVPEIIIDGENGFLIPPGDVEALADIFVKIANSPTFLEQPNSQKSEIKLIEQDVQEFEQIYFKLVQHKSVAAGDDMRAFQEIRELISEKKFIDGLNLLAKIIDENPQHPEALNLMGEIYERLGKTTEAVELQNMAKQLSE
ncbi:glycosyltransferase [candidate division KSB1 bacterium]|nr:glycosyltransferase [candidate division KSB1 bacterium]